MARSCRSPTGPRRRQDTIIHFKDAAVKLRVPTTNNVFTVGSYEPQSELVKFVQCLEKSDEDKDLRQQAVWIMSDNPTWEQFREIALT